MNEQVFGFKIKRLLDSALDVDLAVQNRLSIARSIAVSKRSAVDAELVTSGGRGAILGLTGYHGDSKPLPLFSFALSAIILFAGLFAINHWYEYQVANEIEEIDAQVLTGDLPLDAYLDKGFDTWLKRSSR